MEIIDYLLKWKGEFMADQNEATKLIYKFAVWISAILISGFIGYTIQKINTLSAYGTENRERIIILETQFRTIEEKLNDIKVQNDSISKKIDYHIDVSDKVKQ